jgi:hypothetical protein
VFNDGIADSSAWSHLIVDEGEPAQATGTLVHLHRRPQIVTDGGSVITSNGEPTGTSMAVPLSFDGPSADLSPYSGSRVTAIGHLRKGFLSLRTADDVTVGPGAAAVQSSVIPDGTSRAFVAGPRLPAERDLMREGTLLDAWTDEETGRRVALAAEPERVRAVLADHYGDSLDVVASRWSLEYLDAIRLAVPDRLLVSFGSDIGPDRQVRTTLTILHLPSTVALLLRRFSADALALSVLITPRTRPSLA